MKKFRELEKIIKGVSNHRRIQILDLIHSEPDLSIFDISEKLKVNFKTISEHVRRLTFSGLVYKRSDANSVRHSLSRTGKSILMFLRTLE